MKLQFNNYKKWHKVAFLVAFVLLTIQCEESSQEEFDTISPEITVEYPEPCELMQFGNSLRLKAVFSDNVAVKSYKLNMHHNFDHHTHGDHKEVCEMDEIKIASNPFLQNWVVNLPESESVSIDTSFALPPGYEGGDYHVLLYLTDINGNQSWKGVSIKLQAK